MKELVLFFICHHFFMFEDPVKRVSACENILDDIWIHRHAFPPL